MPTYSRPVESAMAVIRSAMASPPVLGSTLRPKAAGRCGMYLLLASRADPSVLGDPGQGTGQQVLLGRRQPVQQQLTDDPRVDRRGPAQRAAPGRRDGYEDPAPVIRVADPGQPAVLLEAGGRPAQRWLGQPHRRAEFAQPEPGRRCPVQPEQQLEVVDAQPAGPGQLGTKLTGNPGVRSGQR